MFNIFVPEGLVCDVVVIKYRASSEPALLASFHVLDRIDLNFLDFTESMGFTLPVTAQPIRRLNADNVFSQDFVEDAFT